MKSKLFYVVPFPPNSVIKDSVVYKMVMGADRFLWPHFFAAGKWHPSCLTCKEVIDASDGWCTVNPQS